MKKFLIAFIFCFFLLPIIASAESLSYTNRQNHYFFTLPSGWKEIPKSTIDDFFRQLANEAGGTFINYAAGFQLEDAQNYFQYPYVLIQEHKINTPSFSQIIKEFESNKFSESVDKEVDKYSEFMANATFQDPFFDEERKLIFMNLEMDVVNIGKVKGLIVMFLGKESIIQLNFYSVKSEYSKNLLTFNQIINSFSYEQGYQYNEEEAKNNNSSSIFEDVTNRGVTGAVTGGLIALIFGLFSKLKKKNKN